MTSDVSVCHRQYLVDPESLASNRYQHLPLRHYVQRPQKVLTVAIVGDDASPADKLEQSMPDLPSMGEHSNRDVRNPISSQRLQFCLSRSPVASRIRLYVP